MYNNELTLFLFSDLSIRYRVPEKSTYSNIFGSRNSSTFRYILELPVERALLSGYSKSRSSYLELTTGSSNVYNRSQDLAINRIDNYYSVDSIDCI